MFVRSYSFHVSHQYTLHVIIISGETTHRRCLVIKSLSYTYNELLLFSQDISELPNPGGSVQWPKERMAHSSVLINSSTRPQLLVVGGPKSSDFWLFDINEKKWKQLVSS